MNYWGRPASAEDLALYLLFPFDATSYFKFEAQYGKTWLLPPDDEAVLLSLPLTATATPPATTPPTRAPAAAATTTTRRAENSAIGTRPGAGRRLVHGEHFGLNQLRQAGKDRERDRFGG